MNNIVPDSVNDRINVLFKQLNSVNKTIKNINSDYLYDSSDHSLVIKGSSFTINTDNSGIFLGDKTTPDSMILYGTDDPTTISISGVPNGSLYLTKDKLGAGYIKTNGEWLQLATTSEDINVNGNMNVSGNVIVGDNIYVEKNTDIYGDMNVSGDVVINGNLDVDTSIYANDLNIGSGKTIITSDINTEEINATSLSLTEDISCNGNIISSGSITAENLNINSKFNIDSSGNLDTSGYINLSG